MYYGECCACLLYNLRSSRSYSFYHYRALISPLMNVCILSADVLVGVYFLLFVGMVEWVFGWIKPAVWEAGKSDYDMM